MTRHSNKAQHDPFDGLPEEEVADALRHRGRLRTDADLARETWNELQADHIPYNRDAMEPDTGPEGDA